jgi:hypothetical protein
MTPKLFTTTDDLWGIQLCNFRVHSEQEKTLEVNIKISIMGKKTLCPEIHTVKQTRTPLYCMVYERLETFIPTMST